MSGFGWMDGTPPGPVRGFIFMHTKKTRQHVYAITKGRCFYCGDPLDPFDFVLDHFIPKIAGGSDEWENLRPACSSCNNLKNGSLDLERLRFHIGRRRVGAPNFTTDQLVWLSANGVSLPIPSVVFFFENYGQPTD